MNTDQRVRADALRTAKSALSGPMLNISAMPGKGKGQSGPQLNDLLALADWIIKGDQALDEWGIG